MRSLVERSIVALCVLVLVAGIAHDLGTKSATQEIATTCKSQSDERLQANIQRIRMAT